MYNQITARNRIKYKDKIIIEKWVIISDRILSLENESGTPTKLQRANESSYSIILQCQNELSDRAKLKHGYESYRQPKLMMFNEFTIYSNITVSNRIKGSD
jgi:hypothetical protein